MSEAENMALVGNVVDAWNANDWDAMSVIFDPRGGMTGPEGWPESGRFEGWPAMQRQFEVLKGSWSEERIELVETRARGDKVFGAFHWIAKGEASGASLETTVYGTYTWHDGLCTDILFTVHREKALAAAGIEEAS